MSNDPLITTWRPIALPSGPSAMLVGIVSGHPLVKDGWVTTSIVLKLDRASARARTNSRWYRLGDELPDYLPLPPGAQDVLLARIVRIAELQRWSGWLEELKALRDHLSAPLAKLQ